MIKVPDSVGCVLHDCHAEVLAIRAFNSFLLEECYRMTQDYDYQSPVLERTFYTAKRHPHFAPILVDYPFTIYPELQIVMYCSEAPCGDASQELVMATQADATPWSATASTSSTPRAGRLLGREDFGKLGIVRRKPGK